MSEGNEDKEKNTKNNFMKNIWFDKSFGKCYLNECEGEVDIGAIEKKINCKIKEVYLEENSKNISLTNYSLPLRLNFYDSVRSLEELKEIVNLNWLHDNKEVSLSVSNVEKNLLAEHATDPFIRKTAWNLVSGRGNRICVVYGIERLIDISDLDQIIDNYDYSRFAGMRAGNEEDVEYHQKLFGGREKFAELYTAFDNLSNRIKARNLIIVSRLLADKEDLAA
ncbi:19612_t:CDS:1, partial [Racocetra persica]